MASTKEIEDLGPLRRFIYLGTEENHLHCGNQILRKSSVPGDPVKIQCLEAIENSSQRKKAIEEILEFYLKGNYITLDAIMYSLAFFAHSKDPWIISSAFETAYEICSSSIEMFSFVRYYKQISSTTGGWGRAHRNFLKKWYNGKGAKDLADEVLKWNSQHKWTHKDILCMAHVKPKNPAIACVNKYVMKGIEEAEKDFGTEPQAEAVLKYLKSVHQFKHTTDPEEASRLIELHDLSLEHVPSELLKFKEIWLCLIPRLSIDLLLEKLAQINKLGLLKQDSPHYKLLMERLTCENVLANSKVGPLETFVALRKLLLSSKVPGKSVVVPQTAALDDALQNLHLSSFKNVTATGKKIVVAIDSPLNMNAKQSFGCAVITPAQTAYTILIALAKSDLKNLTTVAFGLEDTMPVVNVNETMVLSDIAPLFDEFWPNIVNGARPIQWAMKNKQVYDLFVVFTDYQPQMKDETKAALKEYRNTMNQPNARLIIVALCARDTVNPYPDEEGILTVSGFNIGLLKIIQDYAQSIF